VKPLFNGPSDVKDQTQGTHGTQQNSGCGITKSIAGAPSPTFPSSTFVRAPAITDRAGISTDLDPTRGITLTINVSGATGHHAHRADQLVRQCQRHHHRGINSHDLYSPPQPWEAAHSRRRCSYKISASNRSVLRAHETRDRVGSVVPVGVETIDAVERPYAIFDQRDRRIRRAAGFREALRAVSGRGRAR
jgi:hypothetical protein